MLEYFGENRSFIENLFIFYQEKEILRCIEVQGGWCSVVKDNMGKMKWLNSTSADFEFLDVLNC